MGPIPHHMHQSEEQAQLVGRRGKPEAYYFPPQYNQTDNNFPYTFMGLEPGTTKADVRRLPRELEPRRQRHPESVARVPARAGHRLADRSAASCTRPDRSSPTSRRSTATCSRCSSRRSRAGSSPWDLLIKDVPPEHHHDLDYLVEMLDWDANVNPTFAASNRVFPMPGAAVCRDRARRLSRAVGLLRHALVLGEGADRAAEADASTITRRGSVRPDPHAGPRHVRHSSPVSTPSMIRFGQMTEDELFVTAATRAAPASASRTAARPIRSSS